MCRIRTIIIFIPQLLKSFHFSSSMPSSLAYRDSMQERSNLILLRVSKSSSFYRCSLPFLIIARPSIVFISFMNFFYNKQHIDIAILTMYLSPKKNIQSHKYVQISISNELLNNVSTHSNRNTLHDTFSAFRLS